MILTPYQTRAGSVYQTGDILVAIKKAEVLNSDIFNNTLGGFFDHPHVKLVLDDAPDVPGFVHPLVEVYSGDRGMAKPAPSVYVDARPYVSRQRDGSFKFRSENDFRHELRRAVLSLHWVNQEQADFIGLGELPLKLYINWVSAMVSRHLAVDPLVQFKIGALAGIFYLCQHYDDDRLKEDRLIAKIADRVAQAMRASTEEVLELIEATGPIRSVEAYVEAVKGHVGSVRLENFSIVFLYNVVGGSWFGNNAKEKMAIALEHPPTWIHLLYMAMNDRSYRKAGLTQLVATFTRPNEHSDFARSVGLLLED